MTAPRLIDRDEVLRAVRVLIAPGSVTELRALDAMLRGDRSPGTLSGYFDSPEALADAAAKIVSARGIYIIPNEVNPALLARAANRLRRAGKGDPLTGDDGIVRRRWLLIDCDPSRPSGISATEGEHEAALGRARSIREALRVEGWPEPSLADSGNGAHLLYRIDLAADDGGLVQRCLAALAARFDGGGVTVDTTVHNPARIWKLYGTLAGKGDSTPDRPHRMARLIDVREPVEVVPDSLLHRLAATAPTAVSNSAARLAFVARGDFDLGAWIAEHFPDADGPKPWRGTGQIWTLPVCPFKPEHTGGSAYIGRSPDGPIAAGCHHNSCQHWGWRELRERFDPADRRQSAHAGRAKSNAADARSAGADGYGAVTVRLSDVTPERIDWLWPGRVALGKLTLIAGDPGLGKSFLTLDMAARVSRGWAWPDPPHAPQTPGGVVLLSAEDDVADTIRPRLDAVGGDCSRIVALQAVRLTIDAAGKQADRQFDLTADLPALEQAIREVERCRLVVIDPVTAYLGAVDSHKNAEIRGLLAPLARLAAAYGVAIVLVDHLNKATGRAAIYRTMGSIGTVAASRAAWGIVKDKTNPRRRLMLPIKSNLAPDTGGLAYTFQAVPGHEPPVLAWDLTPVSVTADDALAAEREDTDRRGEVEDAAEWLHDFLGEGPQPAEDVFKQADAAGFSRRSIERAKRPAGVRSRKAAFGGGWVWVLAEPVEDRQDSPEPTEDRHTPCVGGLGAENAENTGNHSKTANFDDVAAFDHPPNGEAESGLPFEGRQSSRRPPTGGLRKTHIESPKTATKTANSGETCFLCRRSRWWRPRGSAPGEGWTCGMCHPPTPPQAVEWRTAAAPAPAPAPGPATSSGSFHPPGAPLDNGEEWGEVAP